MREQLQEIFATVSRNKLRTFLTGFSVAWGIFMLIILLGSGNGLKNASDANFEDMTVNSMRLSCGWTSIPYKGFQSGRFIALRESDMQLLKNTFPHTIDEITSSVFASNATISRDKEFSSTTVFGVNPGYDKIEVINVTEGRFISETDIKERRKVVVLDEMMVQTLFKGAKAVGQNVIIANSGYTVVGVYKSSQNSYSSRVYAPISTVFLTFMQGKRDVANISFTVNGITTDEEGEEFKKQVRTLLAGVHSFSPDDQNAVWIQDRLQWYRQGETMSHGIMLFIWIIGIGTLIAGVVGVSNIMLVTVRERTFEFGVRKAMGAKPASLVRLILLESILIMAFFGYTGMILGVGAMEIVNFFMERAAAASPDQGFTLFKNPTLDLSVTFSATLVLVVAGIIAGYVPARRAARIKTIDAMRHNK